MARIRSVHPGIFTDEAFMTASAAARLLIFGLWCEAHDDGVFEWKPLTLKVRLMPADAVEVAPLLAELEGLNIIRRFQANGKAFGVIRNFQRYQRPKKPRPSGLLPDELRSYATGDGVSSPPEEDEFGTGGEPVPPGEEDGGGRGIGGGEEPQPVTRAREAGGARAAPARSGSDELGPWLRGLVGTEPVALDPNPSPIADLLHEGLTRADVEAGIAAAMADPSFRPRSWKSLIGWVRRAAQDRLGAAPKSAPPLPLARSSDAPTPLPDPVRFRGVLVARAADHYRGRWRDVWPNANRPDHPDCTLAEDVIAEARAIVDAEEASWGDPIASARTLGFIPASEVRRAGVH